MGFSLRINQNAVAYSTTTMAAWMMNSVFQFYYVKLFIERYHITDYWFNCAQIIYMIWNAINDPLFGYFQDHSNMECLKHRRLNILYGGPLFVLSFLLPWFGWVSDDSPPWLAGAHLLFTLACYDCMFTFVLLAQCSLFAEISRNNEERETLVYYSSVAAILGSSAVLFTEITSQHMKNIGGLQMTCIIIAIISAFLFRHTGRNVVTDVNRGIEKDKEDEMSWSQVITSYIQILKNLNFISFVFINFLQILHSTFCANFFSIFREKLVPNDALPSIVQSFLAGTAFMFPHLTVLLLSNQIRNFGSYNFIKFSFVVKICMAVILFMIGMTYPILIAIYMVLDSTMLGATSCLFNLPVAFVIDNDQKKYNRANPLSFTVFGLNALITKPAQSLAPMITVYLLNQSGYKTGDKSSNGATEGLRSAMFNMIVLVPLVLGMFQYAVWKLFKLRSKVVEEIV